MAKSWARCYKAGRHGSEEGWDDRVQKKPNVDYWRSHVCPTCRSLWVETIPATSISSLVGPEGIIQVGE